MRPSARRWRPRWEKQHPLLQAVKAAFLPRRRSPPSATREELQAQAQAEALPELPDPDDLPEDWDPFVMTDMTRGMNRC